MAVSKKNLSDLNLNIVLILAICTTLFVIFLIIFKLTIQSEKIAPKTLFSNYDLGGHNHEDAWGIVNRAVQVYNTQPVVFVYEGQRHELNLDDIGVTVDVESTFEGIKNKEEILSVNDFRDYLFEPKNKNLQYTIDTKILGSKIDSVFGLTEKDASDAKLTFNQSGAQLVPGNLGNNIDRTKLAKDLNERLGQLNGNEIEIRYISSEPLITDDMARQAQADFKLSNLSAQFVYGYDKWSLTGAKFYEVLGLFPKGQHGVNFANFAFGRDITIVQSSYSSDEVEIALDSTKFDSFTADISKVINKPARDATLRFENGKVTEFQSAQDGQELIADELKEKFYDELKKTDTPDKLTLTVDIPVKVTKAKIANKEINSLGIKELVGTGVSYFAGSIPNRVHNIGLGASLINGTLVPPGETFSFVGLVGPVSADQGFKSAYVIKSGRTVLDDGGGICQVSTTVFRAALNSGMPIVKRTAHAYRVSYYEQHGFKAGMDATIFSPTVDLQFKNDTAHHLLVQTTLDRANARLQVDFYGTSDGRKVEVSEPIVSNIKPAPEPKYEDDPTSPKGTVKQVDFAAAGANSVFTRKVYKGDELIIDDTFKSVFRPWQAVFLVGTG